MYTMRLFYRGTAIAMVVLACVLPAWGQWSRDFEPPTFILPDGSGTLVDPSGTTGMVLYDPIYEGTAHQYREIWNEIHEGSLRMGFNGLDLDPENQANDSGLMIDYDLTKPFPAGVNIVHGNISAKVLIRYSTNPLLATTPTDSELNAGWLLRVDLANFNGYICVMDDRGKLQLQKLTGMVVADLCPGVNKTVANFDVTKDWWMRFELVDNLDGSTTVRAHAWMDGTDEPNDCADWNVNGVQCIDANPLPDGAAALLINEDSNITDPPQGNFIDMDNASISDEITCVEICTGGDDEDGDGLVDCADPDCDFVEPCACPDPFADADRDTDVDQIDFALFQRCFTGEGDPGEMFNVTLCNCFDRDDVNQDGFRPSIDGDNDVDGTDMDAFEACASGPGIAANITCDGTP